MARPLGSRASPAGRRRRAADTPGTRRAAPARRWRHRRGRHAAARSSAARSPRRGSVVSAPANCSIAGKAGDGDGSWPRRIGELPGVVRREACRAGDRADVRGNAQPVRGRKARHRLLQQRVVAGLGRLDDLGAEAPRAVQRIAWSEAGGTIDHVGNVGERHGGGVFGWIFVISRQVAAAARRPIRRRGSRARRRPPCARSDAGCPRRRAARSACRRAAARLR